MHATLFLDYIPGSSPAEAIFMVSSSRFQSGSYDVIVARRRGSADGESVQRTQIAFPQENVPAVLEGCSALVISSSGDAGEEGGGG